ncbi:unnamed protein product [Blumeria hordei]|uniref:DUF4604 domain-containing protein n=1 Tax=Blumeria hordei TaxID=2867405 RepID=A0A383UNB1_BLUHO|nr:unnamed protein product [Blumeria hordei]
MKITSKNLLYNSTLPPFLARLQAENSDNSQRHVGVRGRKPPNADEIDENEPVYFDEETNCSLTKTEWEAKQVESKAEEEELRDPSHLEEDSEPKLNAATGKINGVAIGISKKRKTGKIICGDQSDCVKKDLITTKSPRNYLGSHQERGVGDNVPKKGKNCKRMKLSFDD